MRSFSIRIAKNYDEKICCLCESDKILRLYSIPLLEFRNHEYHYNTRILFLTNFYFKIYGNLFESYSFALSISDYALIHNRYQEVISFERIQFFIDGSKKSRTKPSPMYPVSFLCLYCRMYSCVSWKRKPESTIDIAPISDYHINDQVNIVIIIPIMSPTVT